MIRDLPNGLNVRKPEELRSKNVQAVQQQEAAKKLEQNGQELAPNEQVTYSKEASEDLNGAWQREEHQGMSALMANFSFPDLKKTEAVEKVNAPGKGSEVTNKQTQPRELRDEDQRGSEKTRDPKAADRMGNLKVSSKKDAQGVQEKPKVTSSEPTVSHHKPGSKGAPKTDAPRPVGAPENARGSKPDGKTGQRLLPQMRNTGSDAVDFSEETRQTLAS